MKNISFIEIRKPLDPRISVQLQKDLLSNTPVRNEIRLSSPPPICLVEPSGISSILSSDAGESTLLIQMSIQFGKKDTMPMPRPLKTQNCVWSLTCVPDSMASHFPNPLLWIVWRKCRPGTTRTRNIIYWLLSLSFPPPFLTLQCRRTIC